MEENSCSFSLQDIFLPLDFNKAVRETVHHYGQEKNKRNN